MWGFAGSIIAIFSSSTTVAVAGGVLGRSGSYSFVNPSLLILLITWLMQQNTQFAWICQDDVIVRENSPVDNKGGTFVFALGSWGKRSPSTWHRSCLNLENLIAWKGGGFLSRFRYVYFWWFSQRLFADRPSLIRAHQAASSIALGCIDCLGQ